MSSKSSIEFKGTKEGIVLQMDSELEFSDILIKLEEKIAKSKDFFKGATIIGIDGRTASLGEKNQLEDMLIKRAEMSVSSLSMVAKSLSKSAAKNQSTNSASTQKAEVNAINSETADLKSDLMRSVKKNDSNPLVEQSEVALPDVETVFLGLKEGLTQFLRGTMRSGRSVIFKGNVVILGDVNPGAEIIADGNIVVMGHLRGVAHAGANGNHDAYVCANKLNPTQLRIGKLITRPPDENHGADSEIAFVKGDMIVIEPYLI